MEEQLEWYVIDVVARLGEYCLVTWEGTDDNGIAYPPSWIHKKQLRTKGFHNALTRKRGWFARTPIWWPAVGFFEGHPDIPFPNI